LKIYIKKSRLLIAGFLTEEIVWYSIHHNGIRSLMTEKNNKKKTKS